MLFVLVSRCLDGESTARMVSAARALLEVVGETIVARQMRGRTVAPMQLHVQTVSASSKTHGPGRSERDASYLHFMLQSLDSAHTSECELVSDQIRILAGSGGVSLHSRQAASDIDRGHGRDQIE